MKKISLVLAVLVLAYLFKQRVALATQAETDRIKKASGQGFLDELERAFGEDLS